MTSPVRALADTLVDRLLAADPFSGSGLGLREYDAFVPDASAAADEALAADLEAIDGQAAELEAEVASPAERTTLAAVRAICARDRLALGARSAEFTVTAMPYDGPPVLFAVAARTVLVDAQAAADYVQRLRGGATWIDQLADRLRAGQAAGRRPVASLVAQAKDWADAQLAEAVPAAFTAAAPPDGWDGAEQWAGNRDTVVRDEIVPALRRWRALLDELDARDDEHAGLHAVPEGAAEYERAIAVHTTLSFTAQELHDFGLAEVARLEDRAVELGAQLGLADLDAVRAAVRAASEDADTDTALAAARDAVRRAEQRAAEIMPEPLPAPCAVEPMPATVADAGAAPHYTRPRRDGSRPGTYWFNTRRATAGVGWDLEAVAFHETVPGHHSQLARSAKLPDLPLLQHLSVTVHSEGWGLYAERLAGEFGLYSDVRAELGAVYIEMHRAARLVVDTGMHGLGWSRQQGRDYLLEHVALPPTFLADEIDRYLVWPGQALAYKTGLREILRLREHAQNELGDRFDLPSFNGALVDCGSVAMPVLAGVVDAWIDARR